MREAAIGQSRVPGRRSYRIGRGGRAEYAQCREQRLRRWAGAVSGCPCKYSDADWKVLKPMNTQRLLSPKTIREDRRDCQTVFPRAISFFLASAYRPISAGCCQEKTAKAASSLPPSSHQKTDMQRLRPTECVL